MVTVELDLPERTAKPRRSGLTVVIDTGLPTGLFTDALSSAAGLVDLVKFGWGTALVAPELSAKRSVLADLGIGWYLGGTLFEKYVLAGRPEAYLRLCEELGCAAVEVSNGTIDLSNEDKCAFVARVAEHWTVVSEVGFKAEARASAVAPRQWAEWCRQDADAGAALVTLEARESGRSGICRADGTLRTDVVDAVVRSGVEMDRLLFEAPTPPLQAKLVHALGPNVNVGNVDPLGVIGLETLRLGLRSDTLGAFPATSAPLMGAWA